MKKYFYQLAILLLIASTMLAGCSRNYRLLTGSFTSKNEKEGLTVFNFNSRTGELKMISRHDVGPNPSYFCYSGERNLLYALNEVMEFNGTFGGGLTTLKYNEAEKNFEKQNEILVPYGGPCYVSLSADSGYIFLANYPNGSVAVVKLDQRGMPERITDTILYNKAEPDASHAHMILNGPEGKYVYVTDLGSDRIYTYDFDENAGELHLIDNGITELPEGAGPRHFVFGPDGSKLYVINELGSLLTVFDVAENGTLKIVQTLSTVRDNFAGDNYCADIHLSADGKFLYGSNRGENSIVTFRIGHDGLLTLAGHTSCGGDWPRNFTLDPSGKFILVGNQKSDYISVFRIDRKTGLPAGEPENVEVKAPACLKFY